MIVCGDCQKGLGNRCSIQLSYGGRRDRDTLHQSESELKRPGDSPPPWMDG